MKVHHVLLIVLLLTSVFVISPPFNQFQVNVDGPQDLADQPDNNQSKNSVSGDVQEVNDNQVSYSSNVIPQPDKNRPTTFQGYNIMEWGEIDHYFEDMFDGRNYPSSAEVIVTDQNQLRVIVNNDIISSDESSSIFEIVNHELILSPDNSVSIGHLDLNKLQSEKESLDVNWDFVEPDFLIETDFTPNDPSIGNQWAVGALNLENAWDTQRGNTSLKVAILDSGVQYTHPDLQSNYLDLGFDWVNDDQDPMDDHGHGTHVAGTVAAEINNNIGVAGVANVSYFAEKILDSSGFGSYSFGVSAIYHAVDQGAKILSNSWGGDAYSQTLQDAINYAASQDVLVIAAAGNKGQLTDHYPASFDNVISVGSVNSNLQKSSFSNYGPTLDIMAPGGSIYSTSLGNSYQYMSGTSMATPHVTGIAALYWSQYSSASASQIEHLLYATSQDLGTAGYDTTYGHGLVQTNFTLPEENSVDLSPKLIQVNYNETTNTRLVEVNIANFGHTVANNVNYTIYLDDELTMSETISSIVPRSSYSTQFSLMDDLNPSNNLTVIVESYPGELTDWDNNFTLFFHDFTVNNGYQLVVSQNTVYFETVIENVSDVIQLQYYINNRRVLKLIPTSTNFNFSVPIFANGSTSITLTVFWSGWTYVQRTFDVFSNQVVSPFSLDIGDNFDWYEVTGPDSIQRQQFTVTQLVDADTVKMKIDIDDIESGSVQNSFTLNLEMNLNNFFLEWTDFGYDGKRFPLIIDLALSQLNVGTKHVVMWDWSNIVTITSIQDSSSDQDQLQIRSSSVNGDTYDINMPQQVVSQINNGDAGYLDSSSFELQDTSLEIDWQYSGEIGSNYYLQANLTNTGDHIHHILSHTITINSVSIQLHRQNEFVIQSDYTMIYPGFTYSFQSDPIISEEFISEYILTTLANGSIDEYKSSEFVDQVKPVVTRDLDEGLTYQVGTEVTLPVTVQDGFPTQMQVYSNGQLVEDTSSSGTTYSYTQVFDTVGTFNITLVQSDLAGNTGKTQYIVNIISALTDPVTPSSSNTGLNFIVTGLMSLIVTGTISRKSNK